MTVQEIYDSYRIMPGLRLHQLRAAAVGKLVCEAIDMPVDIHSVILACLFHDMGNIVKSDFTQLPELIKDEGAEHWERVKVDFISKYGESAHNANVAIAKEIGLPEKVVSLIDDISFSNIARIVSSGSLEQKIAEYTDTVIGPFGALPQKDRFADARARSIARGKDYYSEEGYRILCADAAELERQVFANTSITPRDISDTSIAPLLEELKHFQVG